MPSTYSIDGENWVLGRIFDFFHSSMAHDIIAEAKFHIPDGFFDVWNIILGEKLPKTQI